MQFELTSVEEEIEFLRTTLEAIDSMVNLDMVSLCGSDPDSSIVHTSRVHQQLFQILLVDFLSYTDKKAPVKRTSYLSALKHIAMTPCFPVNGSADLLRTSTFEFSSWLAEEIEVSIWLPSLDLETILRVSRIQYIKMTGDLSKHNLLRAVGVAEDLQQLLQAQGLSVTVVDAMLALEEFYELFHDNLLNYQGSIIAEYLNNIRWGIHEYLRPELSRSTTCDLSDAQKYEFAVPPDVVSRFGQVSYWALMNLVRSGPCMRKFKVSETLKLRF